MHHINNILMPKIDEILVRSSKYFIIFKITITIKWELFKLLFNINSYYIYMQRSFVIK